MILYEMEDDCVDCPQAKAYNVGAMLWDYTSRMLKEIMEENV